jgi:hypothetical protein
MKYEELLKLIKSYGYETLTDNLNIVAVRENDKITNLYEDTLYYYYKKNTEWILEEAKVTTKPGYFYTDNHLNKKGVAILKPGLWKDCFILGQHNGVYPALVQHKPVTVYRDINRDRVIDKAVEDTGIFGINIHKSFSAKDADVVNKWSAGCIAFKSFTAWNKFIGLVVQNINKNGLYSLLLLSKTDNKKMESSLMTEASNIKSNVLEVPASENLINSIKKFQTEFSNLNTQLGLVVTGFLSAKDINAEDYEIQFSEDLENIILTKREVKTQA